MQDGCSDGIIKEAIVFFFSRLSCVGSDNKKTINHSNSEHHNTNTNDERNQLWYLMKTNFFLYIFFRVL